MKHHSKPTYVKGRRLLIGGRYITFQEWKRLAFKLGKARWTHDRARTPGIKRL